MTTHWPKVVIVVLLLAVVGLPFALRPRGSDAAMQEPADGSLIVITPHNEQIRYEMERGFNKWRAEQGLGPIEFDWRASGGTTDLRNGILSQFEAKARQDRLDDGIGADMFFGGGDYDHGKVAKGIDIGTRENPEWVTVAAVANLPEGLFEAAYPRPSIGGEKLYHPDRLWLGTALSSFGIVYNRDLMVMLDPTPDDGDYQHPTTWLDLTDPKYVGWVAMADPSHSGSIATALNTVIARTGWTEGWGQLRRVFANARYFASASTKIPVDVSSGDAAAGMCIDFYGRYQAGAVAHKGQSRVGYVDPVVNGVSMTATSSDPILLLRGAPNRETAEQFIAWVLSKPAQRLWQKKLGSEGGPERFELRRMPIREDLYTDAEKADWVDSEVDPFATAAPLPTGMTGFRSMVSPLSHSMAIDVHHDLQLAWKAILRTPNSHPDRKEMLRLFDELPSELTLRWPDKQLAKDWMTIVKDPAHPRHSEAVKVLEDFADSLGGKSDDQEMKDQLRWTLFFRDRYRQIAAMGEQ